MLTPAQSTRSPRVSYPTGWALVTENRILLLLWRAYRQRLTPVGQWLIAPTVLFAMWGSTSLDNQIHIACLYALGVWLIAALALPFARPRVSLTVRCADRVTAGAVLPVEVTVTRTGRLPNADMFLLPHRLPFGIEAAVPTGTPVPTLSRGQSTTVTIGLRCTRRGVYQLRGFRACSDFPFGLLTGYRVFGPPRPLLVVPHFTPLARLTIAPGRRYEPGGASVTSNTGDALEFVGCRPFREGDSVRSIDWTATARLDQVIVREYRQEYFHRVALLMDTYLPSHSIASQADDFERAISITAAVGEYLTRQEYVVDVFAAGPDIASLTGTSAALDAILEGLAVTEPTAIDPWTVVPQRLSERLGRITTIICVLLDWNPARRALAQTLAAAGAAVKIIVVRDAPPTLDPRAERGWGSVPTIGAAEFARGLSDL